MSIQTRTRTVSTPVGLVEIHLPVLPGGALPPSQADLAAQAAQAAQTAERKSAARTPGKKADKPRQSATEATPAKEDTKAADQAPSKQSSGTEQVQTGPFVEPVLYRVYPTNYNSPDAPHDRAEFVCEIVKVAHPKVPNYWVVRHGSEEHLTIAGDWVPTPSSVHAVEGDPHPARYRFQDFGYAQRAAIRSVDKVSRGGITLDEWIHRNQQQTRPASTRVFRNRR